MVLAMALRLRRWRVGLVKKVPYRKCTGAVQDGMGTDVPQYADPVDIDAFSWAISEKPNLGDLGKRDGFTGRNVESASLTLPPRDVAVLDQFFLDAGAPFSVVGISDCRNGWHGWSPGITVELQRVTG